MHNPLNRYTMILKRWAWMIILGIVICGGSTYVVSKLVHPTYQASSTLILNDCTVQASAYDCTTAGLEALPTYSQLITSPTVLNPVIAQHPGLTLQQLTAMISVKPQSNTLLVDLDVNNSDPQLAAELANEVAQSFAQFSNTQLPGTVQVIPAQVPVDPIGLKSTYAAAIGALVGLGLALALIVIFEWIDDRLTSPEEAQELLGIDAMTIIPRLTRHQIKLKAEKIPALAEGCRILCASLNAAQTIKPARLVMVTSPLAGEGKSIVAANLASFMALSGKRVLLVDANLRDPALDQYFPLDDQRSLSHAFFKAWTQMNVELDGQPTDIPTLQVLSAGLTPSNPAELLQSPAAEQVFEHFRNTSNFDYVIFDTPPLLPVADTQVLASYMQATILVVDASKTPRKVLTRTRQTLKRTHITVLGMVINKSPWPDFGNIHQYLSKVYQQQVKTDITLLQPPTTPQLQHVDVIEDYSAIEDLDQTLIRPVSRDKKSE